jgi:hypothetical protein
MDSAVLSVSRFAKSERSPAILARVHYVRRSVPLLCATGYFSVGSLNVFNAPPQAITSSAIKCTVLACFSCGVNVV